MSTRPSLDELFDRRVEFPDPIAQERLARLVGLDDYKERLAKMLGVLVHPAGLEAWAKKFHAGARDLVSLVQRRPPLVVLSGDVGCGKSELAETIGDAVARSQRIDVALYPMSLSTRGKGMVGEMTQLVSAAFDYTVEAASKLKNQSGNARGAIILLVDEADALAQSRETSQMHHEDRAGVNAFIRGVDRIANARLPAAVIMCTNRIGALDPAVRRRAADVLVFQRPSDEQRRSILDRTLGPIGLSESQIREVVRVTGAIKGRDYGFTFSDLTQRLLPAIVLDAHPDAAITPVRAIEIAAAMAPTPRFQESSS